MSNTEKRIFVSDIHLSDEESYNHPKEDYPWNWISEERVQWFAQFLEEKYQLVDEIVILGDLSDLWIYPTELNPGSTENHFKRIAEQNHNVICAMNKVAKQGKLTYVPGNHDMLITKDILKQYVCNINYVDSTYENKHYENNHIVAEHGHRYCLFNAPDPHTKESHILPLGYFISRADGHKASNDGSEVNPLDVLCIELIERIDEWLDNEEPEFIRDLFQAIASSCGLGYESSIDMDDDINGYSGQIIVKEVAEWFISLYEDWHKRPDTEKGKIPAFVAVLDDIGLLDIAAALQYSKKGRIVIFGHTHTYRLWQGVLKEMADLVETELNKIRKDLWEVLKKKSRSIEELTSVEEERVGFPYLGPNFIYANCGTWASNKQQDCTFVQTEIGDKNACVKIYRYPDDKEPITEKCISLG